ncbi:MAG: hypothetical protein KBF48_13795, partial [Xanthomonadales bacterium]|nr:hypothetical protein [Xanthomonadales bacterium]
MATNIGGTLARMAPVIAAARVNPLLGAAAGAGQAYEGSRSEESDRIDNMEREQIVAMPRFRELIAEETGLPFEEGYAAIGAATSRMFDDGPSSDSDKAVADAGARALQRLKDEAGHSAGLWSAPLGVLQGFIFTGKIGGAVASAARGSSTGLLGGARAAAGTAAGMTAAGAGDAVTEVGQKVAQAYGSTLATGEEGRNLTEDTAADAILGLGGLTNVSAPKRQQSVTERVFGGAGVNAGDVLGDVGEDIGPIKTEGVPMTAGAGVTLDEDGNVLEERSGLALPPPGPPPPGTDIGPAGPLQAETPPDWMVDSEETASAPGDWQAREQAKRQRAGGPGMGPPVDGVPTMAPDEMAQAAFDTAMETATSAMGRAPSKSSVNALAAKVAERFGVDPAALVERNRNPVRVPAPIASVAPAPVAVTQPAAAQPVVAPELPRGRMFRRGRDAEAVELPGGAWLTRRRVAGHWQPWQRRRSFDPSGAHGYVPYQPQSGSVRTPVGTIRVGEDRREAAQTGPKAPNDIIDTIIAAGGISREAARMAGIDPSMLTTRRGATRWLFPRNNGMSLNGLRELLTTEGFFHQDDPDAPPTVSNDDAFEVFNRALQGERIVSPNRAAEEAAYQASLLESNEEAAPPVVEPVVDDPRTDEDEQIAAEFLSRIEADPIARRVFDDFDADEDMDALGIVELTEVAERLGATPSEIRQAYNAQGDADLARNLWELIHNKEIANGPVARERQAGDRDGAPTQPGGAEAARDAARRTRPAGDEGAGAARSGEPVGQAALEQAAELERLRARVAELESVRGANEVTGLPGKAAFEADESLGWSTVAAIDMDGLGRLNDATSHEAANAVMIAMADAMRAAQVDGVRFYHLHGDELAARFQNPDDAASITLALQDALAAMSVRINVTLENGTVRAYSYDGIGITFGLGANYGTADAAAIRSKHEREAAGLRQNKNQPGPPRQLRDLAGIPQRRNDDDPGRQRAGGDVQGEPAALTLTDDTVVTPPVAERPASQASLFAPVTDIDRERLRFERDRPRPPVTDTVDIEEAINQTPPSGGVSVSGGDTNPAASAATTEEYRNGSVEEAVEPQDVFREEGPQSAEDVERRKEAEEAGARREAAAELGQAAAGHDEAGILATGRDDESADGEADQPSAVGDAGVGLRGQAGASRGATGRSRSPAGPVTENAIATEGDLVTLQHGDATVRVRRADWEGDRPKLRTYTKQGKPSQGFADRANLAEVASSKIEDFGEKIGGARKDVWSSFKDQLREVSDDNVLTEPLSKTWPQPDYQKMIDDGADSWVVAFVRSARDEIPRKPASSWKQDNWSKQVKQLRGVSLKLLNGDISAARAKELLAESRGLRVLIGRIELYQLVGHAQSLVGVSLEEHHYSMYMGRNNVHLWVVEKATVATAFSNWPRELATGDTKEQALQAFKEKIASLQLNPEKAKVAAFDIYSYRGVVGYLIGKKVGRNHIDLAGPFPTVGEARAYRDANNSTLVAKLEASKEIPNERRDTNEPRVGEDMRNGQDVTPQMFGDAFGFKGVEFGNWVEQTKRQNDLNEAFDALMDMAAILGIPPKAISLNGELGIAFGARGSGGVKPAAAHYEPGKVVINLTKKNGAGSLGHEWWHALDNYFQRSRGKSEYATEALDVSLASRGSRFVEDAKMRKAMVESFGAVVSAIKNTALKARSAKLDAKRTKEYWTTGREMAARAFESYLITKLQDQNASNDYLANIVDEDTWSAMEKLGFELDGSYPYPTAGEVPIISAAFGKFFDTIESREGADGKVELFSNPAPGWESAAGDQLSQAAVDREVSKAQAEFDGVTIEVMDSIQDAPTSDRTKRLYPGANGLTDGKSRVWIFRHGLQSLQALRMTLAHEIVGHIGVERVIGADWPAVVDAIKRIRAGSTLASPAVVNAVKDAETRYPKADDLTFAREAVAIMAENGVTGSLMDRIVAAVRKYLRRVFGSLQWSDAEIRNLLRRAGEAARKPAVFRGAEFEAAQVVFHGTPH